MFTPRRSHNSRTKSSSKTTPKPVPKGPSPIPKKDVNAFPMRINKYLALKGYATRRGADELILKKIVTVNGRPAQLGDKVNETDVVEVRKNSKIEELLYFAAHKPRGIHTMDTRKNPIGFAHSLPLKGVFPVGALDTETAGLVIMTNDRRIIDRLENPAHPHPKTYFVEALQPLRANFKDKLEAGVSIEGGPRIDCRAELKSPTSCAITLIDPKNHIRQICSMFGAEIARLTRTAILNVRLGNLTAGSYRKIEGQELEVFLKSLGL